MKVRGQMMKKLKHKKNEVKTKDKRIMILKEDVFKYVNITTFIQAWYVEFQQKVDNYLPDKIDGLRTFN
jgi:hypothetical protein